MSSNWADFIDNLVDATGGFAKDELKNMVSAAMADSEDFIRRQGEKLNLYLSQLAAGQITRENFEVYILDIEALTESHALMLRVEAKVRAQRLAKDIKEYVIEGLIKLI